MEHCTAPHCAGTGLSRKDTRGATARGTSGLSRGAILVGSMGFGEEAPGAFPRDFKLTRLSTPVLQDPVSYSEPETASPVTVIDEHTSVSVVPSLAELSADFVDDRLLRLPPALLEVSFLLLLLEARVAPARARRFAVSAAAAAATGP
eukprot:RCo020810